MSLVLDGTNGISGCPAVSSAGDNVPPILGDNAGNTATCRAWVRFGWIGSAVSVGASFNVSSITRTGSGVYTINFTNSMQDTNYSIFACGSSPGVTNAWGQPDGTPLVNSVAIAFITLSSGSPVVVDVTIGSLAIFR